MDLNHYQRIQTKNRMNSMAYAGTQTMTPKEPLTQEVLDFGKTITQGKNWVIPDSDVQTLSHFERHAFTVAGNKNATGLQLTLMTWPRFLKNDYGQWNLNHPNRVYMNIPISMMEMAYPGLGNLAQYTPGHAYARVYVMSSMLTAMLWQKSTDTPDGWQQYIGPIEGVPPMIEEVTEQYLETLIKLEQINVNSMTATKAMGIKGILDSMRGQEPEPAKKKIAKKAPKIVIKDLMLGKTYDEYYGAPEDNYFDYE